ncbi:hypothetical protein [Nocardioides pantholopis]|uniref:hypothetical protein n=1 Tax=Nocardioides pantholopis TaxID=2483798 RepID=UPI000F08D824|nr:hypothetical protein [Nocardioides pantholopis]
MESERIDLAAAQRAAERAEAAPYIDYPPTPAWYYPVGGAWAAAYVALLGWWRTHQVWLVLGMLALSALVGALLGWYSRRAGAMPSFRRIPRELRRGYAFYLLGVLVVVGLVALAWWLLGHLAAVATAFVVVAVGLLLYDRAYAAAARRTRERLA